MHRQRVQPAHATRPPPRTWTRPGLSRPKIFNEQWNQMPPGRLRSCSTRTVLSYLYSIDEYAYEGSRPE